MWEWWKDFYTDAKGFEGLLALISVPIFALFLFILHRRNQNDK
jgi:hypothetical protein